jgi:bleomycin hydrolase
MSRNISIENIQKYQDALSARKEAKVLQRAVNHDGINQTASNFSAEANMNPVFSTEVDTGQVANQKHSGRCWIFAALNTMRHNLAKNFNLGGDFELSQIYTTFWDKFEKSNWFLENIIKTADQPLTSRRVSWLLESPQQDGGQWDMLCAVIEKYGVVPQSAMIETANSNDTSDLNAVLNLKLRKDAIKLRKLVNEQSEDVETVKDRMLSDIYRILVYAFGEPVTKFNFEFKDNNHQYHIDKDLTPQTFFKKYVNLDLENYVSLINSPTNDKPYEKTYTVDMLGNVVDGRQVKHLNLSMEELEALTIKQLQNGESVWFGSDVSQNSDRKKGLMDDNLFSKDELFDTDLTLSKAEQLDYKESAMNHAMVITGVDIVDGKPTKWKVENSWGNKVGTKGYFVMSESWFRRFTYQVVINTKYLSDEQKAMQAQKPIVLDPWDPMGTLAFYEK